MVTLKKFPKVDILKVMGSSQYCFNVEKEGKGKSE